MLELYVHELRASYFRKHLASENKGEEEERQHKHCQLKSGSQDNGRLFSFATEIIKED